MPLTSNLFSGDERLGRCLTSDPAHVVQDDSGPHVRLIQVALVAIDGLTISDADIAAMRYGQSTSDAVLAYKKKRSIINHSYQSAEDRIVGKMTIAALDRDMVAMQNTPTAEGRTPCPRKGGHAVVYRRPSYPTV